MIDIPKTIVTLERVVMVAGNIATALGVTISAFKGVTRSYDPPQEHGGMWYRQAREHPVRRPESHSSYKGNRHR